MKEDYYIDMSGRIYKKTNIGIACLGIQTKKHNGCALKGNLIKFIECTLCADIYKDHAKLYAICIYLLIKDKLKDIDTLIICNDEDFEYTKQHLLFLLKQTPSFKIINITELRKKLGRDIDSPADNYARSYRRRALNRNKWNNGKSLDVVEINYGIIKKYWK